MEDKSERSLWDSFKPKAKVIGKFAKHCKDHTKERAELIKFVEHMVEDLKEEEEENDVENRYQFRVRKFSTVPTPKSRYSDKDIAYTFTKAGHDEYCFLCEQQFEQFTKDLFPCRVCTRAFHRKCIENCKECTQIDKDAIDRSLSNTGWSCHICANLSLLLTGEEMNTLVEAFDELDYNHDTFISLEEFIQYKSKRVHLASTDDGKQHIISQFKNMDTDKDGRLQWWEFVANEAKLLIAKRSTDILVDLLTEKEIVYAKAVFSRMDDDKDGIITHFKAMMSYKNWYRKFDDPGARCDTAALDLHADVAAKMIMDHDKTNKGTVSWEDFLAGQAVYIICARPNI